MTIEERRKRNNAYWKSRTLKQRARLFNRAVSELDGELARQYQRVAKRLKIEILNLVEVSRNADGELSVSDLYKEGRYYKLMNQINTELEKLGLKQIDSIGGTLADVYEKQSAITAGEFGLYSTVDTEAAKMVVNELWCSDGKGFSDRIWKNKQALTDKLEQSLFDFVSRGQPTAQLEKDLISQQMGAPFRSLGDILDDDFKEAYNNARRLARTETARIQNRATQDRYREAGFTKYRIIAEPDCCEVCDDLSKEVFDIDDLVIPAHPNCRCAMSAITESLI